MLISLTKGRKREKAYFVLSAFRVFVTKIPARFEYKPTH
jgi:hypothetical protein